ncbi:GNAT family N-acetyltransferase [Bradyrhizobium sp. LjRoot220]|uniref:GNAT family N-acetyltransferase n=1 Tax=Bradyrhizobium sp. LjRoot220 TaxID=3342284 RepID=UPI003ECD76C0
MVNVRPLRPCDVDALYAISLATGLTGGDASLLYRDRKLMGHIYSAPYASLQPDLCLVAEDEAGVAGFVVGTADTRTWERRLEQEWWPLLRRQYPAPDAARMAEWTHDQRRVFMIHHPKPVPAAVVQSYPSHLHMNLLPRLQGRGTGSRMFAAWLSKAAICGIGPLHVGVNRLNARARGFWHRVGFIELDIPEARAGRTIWMGRE